MARAAARARATTAATSSRIVPSGCSLRTLIHISVTGPVTDSIGLAGRASPGSSSRQDLTTAEVLPACSLMTGVDDLAGYPAAGNRRRGQQVARLVVIGGGAAGMSAASAARRVAPDFDVVVCEAGGFAAYGMCGIPYFLGGVVPRAESLLAYPPGEFSGRRGIDLRLNTRVEAIDTRRRQVHITGEGGTGP